MSGRNSPRPDNLMSFDPLGNGATSTQINQQTQQLINEAVTRAIFSQMNQRQDDGESNGGAEIGVLEAKMRLPDFDAKTVDTWFWQVEAKFSAAKITADSTKYYTLIGALPTSVMARFSHLQANPPAAGQMYKTLKDLIISEYSESEQARIKRLLGDMSLGDKKPSQLLADMRNIAANTAVKDDFLRTLWLQNLPDTVRAIIAKDEDIDTNALAKLADRIHDTIKSGSFGSINAVTKSTPTAKADWREQTQTPEAKDMFEKLCRTIDELTKKVDKLSTDANQRQRSRSRSKTPYRRSQQNDETGEKRTFETCWWHFKFGENARKCQEGCKYFSKN